MDDLDNIVDSVSYPDRSRVRREVLALQARFGALRPSGATHIHNDGSESFLLSIEGTIPINYKGNTYNIPVEIPVPSTYPATAPICFVRPVQGMDVKRGHSCVAIDGQVSVPYLLQWRSSNSLVGLAAAMAESFSREPPVYARRADPPVAAAASPPDAGVALTLPPPYQGQGGAACRVGPEVSPREAALRAVTERVQEQIRVVFGACAEETRHFHRQLRSLEVRLAMCFLFGLLAASGIESSHFQCHPNHAPPYPFIWNRTRGTQLQRRSRGLRRTRRLPQARWPRLTPHGPGSPPGSPRERLPTPATLLPPPRLTASARA